MRATAAFVAFIALLTASFAQVWPPNNGQIRQRHNMRAEVVVSGTISRVTGNGFMLITGSGTYNVQLNGNTTIVTAKNGRNRGIVAGSSATVQGFPRGRTILATRVTVRQILRKWHRIPPARKSG